jgi:hypothetical protein
MKDKFEHEIPFPEHIFRDMAEKRIAILKKNWSSDPEKFISNMEKEMKIKIGEYDPTTNSFTVQKLG